MRTITTKLYKFDGLNEDDMNRYSDFCGYRKEIEYCPIEIKPLTSRHKSVKLVSGGNKQ